MNENFLEDLPLLKMKKILILSFHSLPMDVIASYRAMAYLKYFKSHGYEPTLLTHPWGEERNNPNVVIEDYEYGNIIRVPIYAYTSSWILERIEMIPVISKLSILIRWLFGILDNHRLDWDSYKSLKKYCYEVIDMNKFDIVLGIFSPHHHLKLCYELNRRFKIPYVLDFRDLWDNRVIHTNYKPTLKESIQDSLTKKYWNRWLKGSLFFSSTSKGWVETIHSLTQTRGVIVHNGFEKEKYSSHQNLSEDKCFRIIHAGTLYTHQEIDIFLNGCKQFIQRAKPKDFEIIFIGGDRKHDINQLSGQHPNPKKKLYEILDTSYCKITPRIPKDELIKQMCNAQLLLFPSFPHSPGTYAGKIFDYLASKINILMVPDDNSVVGDLIKETQSGFICNSEDEVYELINKLYFEWQENGHLHYSGITSEIEKYSRENQVKRIAKFIDESIME